MRQIARYAFILIVVIATFAMIADAQKPEARLIDEAGDMPCGDYEGRMDLLLAETSSEPSSIAVVVYYEGRYVAPTYSKSGKLLSSRSVSPTFGEVQGRVRWLQNYVIGFRRFPKEKIRFISGGYREKFSIDTWIVPNGAAHPKPSRTVETMKFRKGEPTYFSCIG